MLNSPTISLSKLAVTGAFLALWLGLLLPSLNRNRLQDVDELWHAMPAQNAVLHGHWWPLQVDGRAFFEKPPLMPWLVAVTVAISGQPCASWPYRLWNCLAGAMILLSLVALGALAGRFWGGLFAAALLGLQGDFIFHSRFFSMDTPYLALLSLAAVSMAWALGSPQTRRGAWTAAGVAIGLAFWCKSWFVLALAPAFGLALWVSLPKPERSPALARLLWPLALSIVAWLALYTAWAGPGFLRQELQENLWARLRGAPEQAFMAHLGGYMDWAQRSAPAMLVLALAAVIGLAPRRDGRPAADFVRLLAWALGASWLLGLMLVGSQTINYLLPLEWALALLVGLALADEQRPSVQLLLATLLLLGTAAVMRHQSPWLLLWVGLAFGLALAWSRRAAQPRQAAGWLLKAASVGLLVMHGPDALGLCWRPLDAHKHLAPLLEANQPQQPDEILWAVQIPSRAVDFYSNYKVQHVDSLAQAKGGHAIVFQSEDGALHFRQPRKRPAKPLKAS